MGIHDGHRERVRQRYALEGLDSFNDINTLELLLFYAIPRRDTNALAHALLQKFGSLVGVFDASLDDLRAVEGMTDSAAVLIHLMIDLHRKYAIASSRTQIINSRYEAAAFLLPFFYGRRDEVVYLLCLDAKGKVLDCRALFEGSTNAVAVATRKIVEVALAVNASAVVVAHNHPSGVGTPSEQDIACTHRLFAALAALDIVLLDHFIVAENDYVSMYDDGNLYPNP